MIEVQLSGPAGELGCVSTCRDVSVSELKRLWQETKWDGCGTSDDDCARSPPMRNQR